MWILESRGDFFQGRRMWLKPGKQYLFGRVKKDGVRFALDNKTVSRKHFVITVDEVADTDVGNSRARTVVTITDQGSKTGTSVNGERAKEPRTLTRPENVIRLGTCQEELIVKWEPVVLTFNLLKKEIKAGVLKLKQQRVKDLDIKAIADYIPGTSTLLVVSKRNTAKGLQALVDGKSLVAESYIDALEYAATPTDLEEEENLSPLELDFDSAWPDPSEHLPPQSKEPTVRPSESYLPNPGRSHIFESFVFVFGDQTQYDNLLPPITTGHGKALLFPILNGVTSVDELVEFMRASAGSRSFGSDQRDIDNGAVIMVRWVSKDHAGWTNDLINQVALKLDQRAIEQGEFLDAILANNALSLRQAVPFQDVGEEQVPPSSTAIATRSANTSTPQVGVRRVVDSAQSQPAEVTAAQLQLPARESDGSAESAVNNSDIIVKDTDSSPPTKPFRFSPSTKMQSAEFDDEFDENAIIPFEDDEAEEHPDSMSYQDQKNDSAARSQLSFENSDEEPAKKVPITSSKRPRSGTQEGSYSQDAGDGLDAMLPSMSNLKRRKLAQNVAAGQQLQAKLKRGGVVLPALKSRRMKEVDVREELKAKREEDRKRAQQAGENEDLPIEYDEDGRLPVFEVVTDYMDLPVREKAFSPNVAERSARWDPKWDGRKNFKAFRRARDQVENASSTRRKAHTRVMVPLVDAKQVTYGIGDQYWERTEEDKERDRERKRRANQRTTQSQASSSNQQSTGRSEQARIVHDSDSDSVERLEDEDVVVETSPRVARLQQEAAEIVNDSIDLTASRRTRADDQRSQASTGVQPHSETQSSRISGRGTKRPASAGRGATVDKRQKTLPVQTRYGGGSESDDSDDMKFQFGRGRRGRGRGRLR